MAFIQRLNPHHRHPYIYWRCDSCGLLYAIESQAFRWYMQNFFHKVYIHEVLNDNIHCCSKPAFATHTIDDESKKLSSIKGTWDFKYCVSKRTLKEWIKWNLILQCKRGERE